MTTATVYRSPSGLGIVIIGEPHPTIRGIYRDLYRGGWRKWPEPGQPDYYQATDEDPATLIPAEVGICPRCEAEKRTPRSRLVSFCDACGWPNALAKRIIVTRRTHDYHACIEGTTQWDCGPSPDAAVAALRMTYPHTPADVEVVIVDRQRQIGDKIEAEDLLRPARHGGDE